MINNLWKFLGILCLLFSSIVMAEGEKNPWAIKFEGNSFFPTYQLEEELDMPVEFGNMDTTKQNFLMRLAVEELVEIYYSYGFFSAKAKLDISKAFITDTTTQRVFTFSVTEGERYHFQSIQLIVDDSTKGIPISVDDLKFKEGSIYTHNQIADNLQQISNIYREHGYLHTNLNYMEKIDTVKQVVHVDIFIFPGTQVRMGKFKSLARRSGIQYEEEGLSDTAWLNGLWNIPQGEILNGKQSSTFKSKLFSTQLFTQVKLDDSLRQDGFSDLHLTLQERVPGETKYGVFYEQIYGFGASFLTRHKNFFGRFHEFGLNTLIAQHKQEIALIYANPLFLGTSIDFIPTAIRFENTLSFNHEKITPPAYPDSLEERYEIINRANLTFGFSPNIRFRGTLDTRYVQKNEEKLYKLKVESALSFDFTDDLFNPTKGIRITPTLGAGLNLRNIFNDSRMIGNPYSYGDITTSLYFPIFRPLFGAISGSYGQFFNQTIEDDARLFYQGGSRTVRGYRFRSIYASYPSIDEMGDTITNTGLTPRYFRFNQELRFSLPFRNWRNWQLVQFFDWAYITDKESDLYAENKKASLGLGIRYRWQFLTFRLDYAFKKNFSDWSMESFSFGRIAFDLSQAF